MSFEMQDQYDSLIKQLLSESSSQSSFITLERARLLSFELNHPEKVFPSVHIAGSNGKGSTATKIASSFQKAGYRTGLYTSPHLHSFSERMQINNVPIDQASVLSILPILYKIAKEKNMVPTFFEFATFLAFEWFRREKVEMAVIETGLGGALDATNVLYPVLSIITSVSLEHMDRLGDTLEKIAEQKAGIIKPNTPVVLGPKARLSSIYARAAFCKSPILEVPASNGWYDKENQDIARVALSFLQNDFPRLEGHLDLSARPPCRFELYHGAILDVAHNLDGLIRLYEAIQEHFPSRKIRTVLGLSRDKDVEACMQIAQSKSSALHLVQSENSRAFPAKESVYQGVQKAKAQADIYNEILVVTGSFYLMPDAKKALYELSKTTSLPESRS
jgi:dihydrofolate synthase / folylpolyglutamate synthase